MIKNILSLLILALVCSSAVAGKMYKWVDKNGKTHFSQTAPTGLDQAGNIENISLKKSKKGDLKCCFAIKKIINRMLLDLLSGRTISDLRSKYSTYNINLIELENFTSHKVQSGISPPQISKMGFDTCMNAGFGFCRAGSDETKNKSTKVSSGTGFFVSSEGYIITNEHVAGSCKKISIQPQGIEATLVTKSHKYDLALLKVDYTPKISSSFRESNPILGESIITAGFPYKGLLSSDIKISDGIVSSLAGVKNDSLSIQITAPIQPGNSGGPLLDSHGNVIGVIVSKLNSAFIFKKFQDIPQNVNFAINSEYVKKFLVKNNINFNISKITKKLDLPEISQIAKSFTVEISCLKTQSDIATPLPQRDIK